MLAFVIYLINESMINERAANKSKLSGCTTLFSMAWQSIFNQLLVTHMAIMPFAKSCFIHCCVANNTFSIHCDNNNIFPLFLYVYLQRGRLWFFFFFLSPYALKKQAFYMNFSCWIILKFTQCELKTHLRIFTSNFFLKARFHFKRTL